VRDDAMALLRRYPWPGNVRELRNVIERAVIVEEGDFITPSSLPPLDGDLVAIAAEGKWTLDELESRYIREVLRQTRSNFSRAAAVLGINRKTLLEKRRKYGIE
jgi:DNA-binding NtrC family response regulator